MGSQDYYEGHLWLICNVGTLKKFRSFPWQNSKKGWLFWQLRQKLANHSRRLPVPKTRLLCLLSQKIHSLEKGGSTYLSLSILSLRLF